MIAKKVPKLAIVSERIRNHFNDPLRYFSRVKVKHFYRNTYADFVPNSKINAHQFVNESDLNKKLIQFCPDIIQTYEPFYGYSKIKLPLRPLRILNVVYKYCQKNKISYYFNALETNVTKKKYGKVAGIIIYWMYKKYACRAWKIFAMTNQAEQMLLEAGVKKTQINDEIMIGHWGVETEIFKPSLKTNQPSLVFIGTLNEQKGIKYLVKIISKVIDNCPMINIKIVGLGYYQYLIKNLIKEYPDNIQYFEQVSHSEVAKILARTWIALSTSITLNNSSEQTAGFLLEAMACGNGIVAFNSGGISRYVKNGVNGLLSDEKNIDQIVKNISWLLKDNKILKEMQKNNRRWARRFYNAESNVNKLEELLVKKLVS